MNALILGAGYATRLRPLTESLAKPLLPIAGRPMIEYLCDRVDAVADVTSLHVVTNHRFADAFVRWGASRRGRLPVHVLDDGTGSNDDRLGAIGDIRFALERARLEGDDLMVLAGDNLFDFSLADYVAFWRAKRDGSCIALYACPDPELVKQYSVVEVDADERVTSFVEKPEAPATNLVGIATYLYRREHLPRIAEYLREGNSPDQPGNFVAWLYRRAPVYGYRFAGAWLDIGNHDELLHADNMMRERRGLARRERYSPE